MKRFEVCPVCGSKDIAEYDIALTIFHKYVCRKCLTEWDDSPFSYNERKGKGEE